jgi:dethiobiotin synthetase
MKPVAAGAMKTAEGDFNDDALELLAASNVKSAYADVNPWLLKTPASPHLAARAEGVTIGHDRIQRAFERLRAAFLPGKARFAAHVASFVRAAASSGPAGMCA